MRSNYKTAAILFFILFALGYIVGAMFNGLNTMQWPNPVKMGFYTWFVLSVVVGLMIMFGEDKS